MHPDIELLNLAEDGAMIDDVATEELARLGHDSDDPGILVTLTAGGNDLLDALAAGQSLDREVRRIERRYIDLVATVLEELPAATLVLTTVYDPTDGTGRLPGLEAAGPLRSNISTASTRPCATRRGRATASCWPTCTSASWATARPRPSAIGGTGGAT